MASGMVSCICLSLGSVIFVKLADLLLTSKTKKGIMFQNPHPHELVVLGSLGLGTPLKSD